MYRVKGYRTEDDRRYDQVNMRQFPNMTDTCNHSKDVFVPNLIVSARALQCILTSINLKKKRKKEKSGPDYFTGARFIGATYGATFTQDQPYRM